MGSSESKYEYHFDSRDSILSGIRVFKVDDRESEFVAKQYLRHQSIVYVDCEGKHFGNRRSQQLGLVQVATPYSVCFIFHIRKYPDCINFLKSIFEAELIKKVFHDCSGDASVLFYEYGICLRNVHDTQVAHMVIKAQKNGGHVDHSKGSSLADVYKLYCNKTIPGKKHFNRNHRDSPGGNIWLDNRELTDGMVKYAALDALVLRDIFCNQLWQLSDTKKYNILVNEQLKRKIDFKDNHHFELNIRDEDSSSWLRWILGAAVATAVVVLTRR